MTSRTALPLVLLPLLVLACGSSEGEPPGAAVAPADEITYELFDTTTLLGPADLVGLQSAPDGTLSYATAPASLATVQPGQVLLAGVSDATPGGLLRIVVEAVHDGPALTMKTRQAPIQVAFRKLHLKAQRDVTGFGGAPAQLADVSTRGLTPQDEVLGFDADATLPLDFLLYDADNNPRTTNDQVGIKGEIGGGFHFGIGVDVDWDVVNVVPDLVKQCLLAPADLLTGKLPDCSLTALLPELILSFEADPFMKTHASLYGAASLEYSKSFPLANIPLAAIPIGPVVLVPTVTVSAEVSGAASASFTVGARGAIELTSSVKASTKHPSSPEVVPIAVKKAEFQADDTKIVLQAQGKVGVGAALSVLLWGFAGPYAKATAFAEVQADVQANPCWSLHVGVDTSLGIVVQSPVPFVPGTLIDWKGLEVTPVDEVLGTGACLPVEKGPQLPPGSGPDALTYSTPTFTPWARVTSPVGDDGAISSLLSEGAEWTDDALAIDGRFVTTGSRHEAVVKLDDAGTLIWSRRYRREASAPPLRVRRLVPTHDASMLVLAEAQEGEPASVIKIGQAGGVWFRKIIQLAPESGCSLQPLGLERDADRGFYVLGGCLGDQRAAVVHLDEAAHVLGAQVFGDVERSFVPTAFTTVQGEPVVLGHSSTPAEGSRMFAARIPDVGNAAWANRYLGCTDVPDLWPSQARVSTNDQLTVVGTASDHRAGLLMRLGNDGAVTFANFSRFDSSGDEPFNVHAFAELPTTGMLVAGATANLGLPSGDPGTETSLFLASLDSIGRTLWARRYTLPAGRGLNHASLRLTDDGGALVTGLAEHTTAPGGGLYAMKAYAKDGDLAGTSGVTVTSMPVVEPIACAVTSVPWSVVTSAAGATTADVSTVVEDAAVRVE